MQFGFGFPMKIIQVISENGDMFSDPKMQSKIYDCHDTRKNKMFLITDSLFSGRMGY